MQCHYHEESEAARSCSRCAKPLCAACVHSEHSDYCWSCGLTYENELEERKKAFKVPAWAMSGGGAYVFRKLAAAGATYVAIGSIFALLFAAASLEAASWAGLIAGGIASMVTYTYGIGYSALVDGIAKAARLGRWPVRPVLYAVGGVIYVTTCPLVVSFGARADSVLYVVSALIFHGFDSLFGSPKRRIATFAVAAVTLVPIVFLWAQLGFVAWRR